MKYIISPKIIHVANVAARIPGVKKMLKPVYYYYKKIIKGKRNKEFLKNGINVLKSFDNIMIENDLHYSVFAGTLLGAIREHAFLKHDFDIDTMLFHDEYSSKIPLILESGGFKLLHRFEVENGEKGLEETYVKDNVTIDIFYIYSDEKFDTYQCDFREEEGSTSLSESMKRFGHVLVRRNEFPVSRNVKRIKICDIEVNAIANAEEWLAARYGDDYMIPNPNFKDKKNNPKMRLWNEVTAIYKSF